MDPVAIAETLFTMWTVPALATLVVARGLKAANQLTSDAADRDGAELPA